MKKQTAVEFAVEKLEKLIPSGNQLVIGAILEEAKQMEKKQHQFTWVYEGDIDNASFERFERYYQVTFGGQGSPDTTTSPTK